MVNEQAKSLESILEEKEAILERERTMLEELKTVLDRMGYELVPKGTGSKRPGRRKQAVATPGLAPGLRRRGRPPKGIVPAEVAAS